MLGGGRAEALGTGRMIYSVLDHLAADTGAGVAMESLKGRLTTVGWTALVRFASYPPEPPVRPLRTDWQQIARSLCPASQGGLLNLTFVLVTIDLSL